MAMVESDGRRAHDAHDGLRSTTSIDQLKSGELLKTGNEVQESSFPSSGGYGGVSEGEPPHHTIHTDDELLPKPGSVSVVGEQSTESYQDAPEPESVETYQDSRETDPESLFGKERDGASYDRQTAAISECPGSPKYDRDLSEPTDAGAVTSQFLDAPTGAKVTQRGYGDEHQKDDSEPAVDSVSEPPAKKEGFMAKMMEKLPGHHHKPDEITSPAHHPANTPVEHHDTATTSPKKGLMAHIMDKLPGHHTTAAHGTTR